MKKLALILIMTLISYIVTGQCQLDKDKDPFTGIENISTTNDQIGYIGKNGQINFKLTLSFDKDTTLRLYIEVNRFTIRCFDSTCKILLKVGDEVVTFKLSGKSQCGTKLQDYSVIPLKTFKMMSDGFISAIRVFYTKDSEDFTVDMYNNSFFIAKYNCFSRQYPGYFN
jgi:hypothetical protein